MPPISIRPFSTRTVTAGLFIVPANYFPYHKVEVQVTNPDGTNSTITMERGNNAIHLMSWEVNGRVNSLKHARVVLDNNDGFWANKFKGGETLTIYADYTNTLGNSERIFVGKIDEYRHSLNLESGFTTEITARQTPELEDKIVNRTFSDTDAGTAITTIISENFSGIVTTADVGTIGTNVTLEISNESGVRAITRILDQVGYHWHIREDTSLQVFSEGTRNNDTERAGVGVNITGADGLGRDFKDVKNRVLVYGSNVEDATNIFYLQTRDNTDSQTDLWQRDLVINDGNVDSTEHAAQLALAGIVTSPDRKGSIQCAGGLLTLQPGQSIAIEAPYMEFQGRSVVGAYKHTFDQNAGLNTYIHFSTVEENLASLFQERLAAEKGLRQIANPNNMTNATVFEFDTSADTNTLTNTAISNSALMLSGASTGRWISRTITLPKNATVAELRTEGDDLGVSTYEVSLDNGITYTTITTTSTVTLTAGKQLKIRVTLQTDNDNAVPRLNTLALLTK